MVSWLSSKSKKKVTWEIGSVNWIWSNLSQLYKYTLADFYVPEKYSGKWGLYILDKRSLLPSPVLPVTGGKHLEATGEDLTFFFKD